MAVSDKTAANNRTKTERFRELVQLFLGTHGVVVRRRPYRTPPMAEYMANPEYHETGDMRGLEDVALVVRNKATVNFSDGVDHVQKAMQEDRKALGWLIQYRQNRGVDEAYAVCTVQTLTLVLQRLQEAERKVAS